MRSTRNGWNWVGGKFDPEAFDIEAVNKDLAMMW